MEKKEKKSDLEQLLNSLIEKGWKPFGKYNEIFRTDYYEYYLIEEHGFGKRQYLRNLVSKESNLWQFVCENGMVKHKVYEDIQSWEHTTAEYSDFWFTDGDNYEYYIIESSLKDESGLEDFLLNSIKLD